MSDTILIAQNHPATDLCYSRDSNLCIRRSNSNFPGMRFIFKYYYDVILLIEVCFGAGEGKSIPESFPHKLLNEVFHQTLLNVLLLILLCCDLIWCFMQLKNSKFCSFFPDHTRRLYRQCEACLKSVSQRQLHNQAGRKAWFPWKKTWVLCECTTVSSESDA